MNIQKLANLAGVSPSTVSKAFSGSKEIPDSTRNKIFKLAKEYNCFEKYNKIKFEKKVVAVICPEVKSEYYCSIVSYIENALNKRGLMTVLSISEFSEAKEKELISYHLSSKKDGIIMIDPVSEIKYNKDIPIVAISSITTEQDVDSVSTDFLSPICDAIFLLKQNGHKDIAYIGEKLAKDKEVFFTKAMQKNSLMLPKEYVIVENERFERAGYNAMEKIYSLPKLPTAILAGYDYIALGAMECIRDHGHSVPDDFSIVGIDDISFSKHKTVNLSSIKANTEAMCETALDILIKKINTKTFSIRQHVSIRGELVNRSSIKDLNA